MSRVKKTGPGLIVAAAFIGPGTVTTATLAGANFGYALLWAMSFAILATIILQYMAARVAILTQQGLAEAILGTLPSGTARIGMAILLLAALGIGNAAYEAGNIGGGYLGLETIFPAVVPYKFGAITLLTVAIIGLIAVGGVRAVEKLLIVLVLFMSIGFIASFIALRPDWSAFFGGFVPDIPNGGWLTTVALIGTTIVPYNLFLHAAMAKDRWQREAGLTDMRRDTIVAISLGGIISLAIISTAAAALFGRQLDISNGADMALQMQPLLGSWSRILIGIGLFSAGITSAITAPMATGFVVQEIAAQFRPDLKNRTSVFRTTAIVIVLIGAASALSGVKLVDMIILAQAANGLLLPLMAILLYRLANNVALFGNRVSGPMLNTGLPDSHSHIDIARLPSPRQIARILAMTKTIDLNADLGEMDTPEAVARDIALMSEISSCNIACGGHAGTPDLMRTMLNAASKANICAGAHPSYPDRSGFGRRSIDISVDKLCQNIIAQVETLAAIARKCAAPLIHIKPHGALYNDLADNPSLATAFVRTVHGRFPDLKIVGLAGGTMQTIARQVGAIVCTRGFYRQTLRRDCKIDPAQPVRCGT